jgi:hypothetical protein
MWLNLVSGSTPPVEKIRPQLEQCVETPSTMEEVESAEL